MEATGQYHRLLVEKLHHSLLPVKVVNQRQVRNFARSLNKLCKTDAIDAKILVEFALSRCIISDTPKSEHGTKLSALLVRREQLQFLITQEKCHIESTEGQYAHYIEAILDTLKAQLKEIDASISQVVKKDEKFAQVIVPDDQLSLAIGKAGQNARLAAKLTNWKIDIKSESQFREIMMQAQNEQESTENEE